LERPLLAESSAFPAGRSITQDLSALGAHYDWALGDIAQTVSAALAASSWSLTLTRDSTFTDARERCPWCTGDPLYIRYHDEEWGRPIHDDGLLFEFLILEAAQAGLSWLTILRKRENYRKAFDGFDPLRIARYSAAKIEKLLQNPGIVRNRLKIEAAVSNAAAFREVQREFGSFDRYLWDFVKGKPVVSRWRASADVPAHTPLSDRVSKDLRARGFRFVGSTIVYAYLQAVGVVDDHLRMCFRARRSR
jgi:DNA-3-methyladenine glycosylase I